MKKLTEKTTHAGCAVKFSPGDLAEMLGSDINSEDENLLIGFENNDDASVYLIDDNTALIQTVDIFPPMVDDPYIYGQICAANSISDIYAMGGTPKLALNILCLPEDTDSVTAESIIKGGSDKAKEAGVIITGGHTIKDPVPKYGLSVTGFADPAKLLCNSTALPGDKLILTKKIGTGIQASAYKAGIISDEEYAEVLDSMLRLNKEAAQSIGNFDISCTTDISGFGLLGHTFEISEASNCSVKIFSENIPVFGNTELFASMGILPAGLYGNMKHIQDKCCFINDVRQDKKDILFDPQTSGGLLISVPSDICETVFTELKKTAPDAEIIGEVTPKEKYDIFIE